MHWRLMLLVLVLLLLLKAGKAGTGVEPNLHCSMAGCCRGRREERAGAAGQAKVTSEPPLDGPSSGDVGTGTSGA